MFVQKYVYQHYRAKYVGVVLSHSTPTSQVAAVCGTVKQLTQEMLREINPNARSWNLKTLLKTFKEKLLDLLKWCMEHSEEIADVLQVGGDTLSKFSNPNFKYAGMTLQGAGELLRNVGPRFRREFSAKAANGGSHFDGCALVPKFGFIWVCCS